MSIIEADCSFINWCIILLMLSLLSVLHTNLCGIMFWFCKVFVTLCCSTLGTGTNLFLVSKTLVAGCSVECLTITPGISCRWWWLRFLTCWSCWYILSPFRPLAFFCFVFLETLFRPSFPLEKFLFWLLTFCLQLCISFLSNKECFYLKLCHSNLFWIALSFNDNFEDLELDELEFADLDDFDLLSFFCPSVPCFSQSWNLLHSYFILMRI